MQYAIKPSVFYRLYGDKTVVYDTAKRKIYLFNSTAKDILDCIADTREEASVIDSLKKVYAFGDVPNFEQSITDFLSQLVKLEIISETFKQKQIMQSLEGVVSNASGILYSAIFELTFRCNERCRHCYVVQDGKRELTTAEVFAVLDDLCDLNVFVVTFTGGEVFLRKDFLEILEYAYKKGFVINIYTNGTLITDTDLIKLAGIYPRSVHFSMYSHIAEKHDYITQFKGSFEKTVSTIKKAVALGMHVNIKTTVMEYTKDDVAGMIEFATALGATIQISPTVNPKDDGSLAPTELRINNSEDYAKALKTASDKIEFCAGIAGNFASKADDIICGAGHNMASIAPDGEVYPCNALRISLGNVRQKSLKEIWKNSPALEKWKRASMKDLAECADCELLKTVGVCSFCPGAALQEKGSPFAKYDEACTITAVRKSNRCYLK
jgi:radical SAM protein with 4Fe4S-binding SPASM domain